MANQGRFFPVQSIHFGVVTSPRTMNAAVLPMDIAQGAGSTSGFGLGGQLGMMIEWQGGVYRLIQFDNGSAVAAIDGGVLYWKTMSTFEATSDASTGEAAANGICGGTHVVLTDRYYGFVQCGGDQAAVVVAASAVAGDHLTGHATTDNVLTRTAAGTAPIDKLAATALTTRGTTTSDVGASVSNSSKVRWVLGNLI